MMNQAKYPEYQVGRVDIAVEQCEGEAKVVHDAQLESWHRSKLDDVSTDRLFIHE